MNTDLQAITPKTRIEVIDQTTTGTGREYTKWVSEEFTVKLEEQDGGRTLKIFLEDIEEQPNDFKPFVEVCPKCSKLGMVKDGTCLTCKMRGEEKEQTNG